MDTTATSSKRKESTQEVLVALESAEACVHAILHNAADTLEQLSALPVVSEKKINALVDDYLLNIRRVQETLKTRAYILDLSEKDREKDKDKDDDFLLNEKRKELAANLAALE